MNTRLQQLYYALSRCQHHPVMGKHVEWIDINFVLSISNPSFKPQTDLGLWGANQTNERVGLDALVEDILARGMRDPFILGIGSKTSMMRLETGNQRIRALAFEGIRSIPVVGLYSDHQITNRGNGEHVGCQVDLIKPTYHDLIGPYQERRYCTVSSEVRHRDLKCSVIPEHR